jgi:hypothetical protein
MRRRWIILLAVTAVGSLSAALAIAAGKTTAPERTAYVGVIVPGQAEILGPRPVLRGSVPPGDRATVQAVVYRATAPSAPIARRSTPVVGSTWRLPLSLGPGGYVLRVEQRTPRHTLIWTRTFSVSDDPVIAAAGDIACDPRSPSFHAGAGSPSGKNCQERATSDLLVGGDLAAVLTLGDEQYESAQPSAFAQSFGPTWGRLGRLIRPVPGNHEYPNSAYFSWFSTARHARGPVGTRQESWYSYAIGSWHVIALNSNCGFVGGCGAGSPELRWLQMDLRLHPSACTLAYWHHPRFSSGKHGDDKEMSPIWQALQDAGADVVLVGHDHDYERFAPQTADGARSYARGIREFVVGTGGKSHDPFRTAQPNSQRRNSTTYGVLELVLHARTYDWRFVPVAGKSFSDAGTAACHGRLR